MISIKKATLLDLKNIQKLNHDIMSKNASYDPCIIIDFDLSEIGKEFFTKAMTNPQGLFYIAFDNKKMVGYINGGPKKYVYRKKKFFEIENLGVIPEYRKRGVGTLLYNSLVQELKKHGYERIYLNCYSKNDEALCFYKKLGFEEIDISLEKDI
jgi:ribosomal protein S18 acetylase RimI-like enzyme